MGAVREPGGEGFGLRDQARTGHAQPLEVGAGLDALGEAVEHALSPRTGRDIAAGIRSGGGHPVDQANA